MKLLFVSQYIYRPDQAAANRIYDLLQATARAGHEVVAVAGGVHYLEERIDPELERDKIVRRQWEQVTVYLTYATPNFRRSVLSRLRSYFSFAWYGFRAAWRVKDVDLILVSIQPIFVAPLAWMIARIRGVPLLVEVRDLWPDAAAETGLIQSRLLLGLGRLLERFVYRTADHLVTIGPQMKEAMVRKGVPSEKIDVMPQGFQPPDEPVRSRESVRQEVGLGDECVVIFTGSFGLANNDIPLILDAAAELHGEPGLRFLMIGEGNQKAACVERVEREGLTNVQFLPMVPKSEVHAYLRAADVAVMTLPAAPFWRTALQNKIFDYMGNGLPVVAAVEGDQADLLQASSGGVVVQPGDAHGLAEGIRRLLRDPDERRLMGDAGRRHIQAHLMRSSVVSDYISLIERVAVRPGHQPTL